MRTAFHAGCSALGVLLTAHASAAVTSYEIRSDSVGPNTIGNKSLLVECPEGKYALGGGSTTLDADGNATDGETIAAIWGSTPFGFPPSGWTGAAYSADPAPESWGLRVEVICGSATGFERVDQVAPLSSNASKFTQAICPEGKVPLGGGAQTLGTVSSTFLQESVDAIDAAYGFDPGWAAFARGPATSGWNVTAMALCTDEATAGMVSVYETTAVSTDDVLAKTTGCPEGLLAVGGSVRPEPVNNATATGQARLTDHGPAGPPDAPTGWTGMVRRPAENDAEWRLSVGVVCVPEPSGAALAAIAALFLRRAQSAS